MSRTLRGFRDILPPDSELFSAIEDAAREVFRLHGYREIRIPTLETKELFVKSTGDTTDIVEKEMYAFTDGGGREVAMRPEGTPGVARAYIEQNLSQGGRNAKLFYIGPMFRAERPQAGRYREFTQIGVECIGNASPAADAESISLLVKVLEKAGAPGCTVELNTLGCADCRKAYRDQLLAYLKLNTEALCEACKRRVGRNPMRALDCKVDGPWLADKAPHIALCPGCVEHFDRVQALLKAAGTDFRVNRTMVRGLDYYTRTVFEVKAGALGAQDAVAGGGRYDDLIKSMGGPASPSVGWAMGLDRAALVIKAAGAAPEEKGPAAFFVAAGKEAGVEAFRLMSDLRAVGIAADYSNFDLSVKSQMRSADKSGADYAVIIGEDELKEGACSLKPLKGQAGQESVPFAGLASRLTAKPA
jgi:histidyl-tRNA synthetase